MSVRRQSIGGILKRDGAEVFPGPVDPEGDILVLGVPEKLVLFIAELDD